MKSLKELFTHRLTFLSGTVAVSLLAVAGALLYGSYLLAADFIFQVRVRKSIPKVLQAASKERDQLVSAIEAYHSHFGFYPPDHVLSDRPLRIDPVTNLLYYELTGAVYNPTNDVFYTDGAEPLKTETVKQYFNTAEFKNKGASSASVKHFFPRDLVALREIHDDPDVMVLSPNLTGRLEGIPYSVLWEWKMSGWQYVSSSPTNNPGKFDLWAELEAAGQKFMIRNWP